MQASENSNKKILDSSPLSGIAVPLAIVLVGALIIFGVTKMLSSGKNHRDLIEELNSKTFGNRWVAAYELSKYLAGSKIPPQDYVWVIENLTQTYKQSVDARTRNFVVLAIGSLKEADTVEFFNMALEDLDPQVIFNVVVSIGNQKNVNGINWDKIISHLKNSTDVGLKQVCLLTLAHHKHPELLNLASGFINSSEKMLRYNAAIVLIQLKQEVAIPIIEEIFKESYTNAAPGELNGAQVEALKVNALEMIERANWRYPLSLIEKLGLTDSNIRVSTKSKQILKVLKN